MDQPAADAARAEILDAAQQAWSRGETLESWVTRYPAYALDLAALALALARQQAEPAPPEEEVAHAAAALTQAMEATLGPAEGRTESPSAAHGPLAGTDAD
jgi:hypothetical protein